MVKYEFALDIEKKAKEIVNKLKLKHIDFRRVFFIRSYGAKTNALARCYGLSKIWQKVLGIKAQYIIEIVSENFDNLNEEEKIKTLIHELLHIPKSFGGGFRHHDFVNDKIVSEKFKELYED